MKRVGRRPVELALSRVFLASPESSYVTSEGSAASGGLPLP